MTRRAWTLVSLAISVTLPSWGRPLSLQQAMQLARQQHGSVQAARAEASAAEQKLEQAKGFRWPRLDFSELWLRTDSPAEAFALKLNQERFSFGQFMLSDPNNPKPLETAVSRFELQWPVFTGGEIAGRIAQAQHLAAGKGQQLKWEEDQAALAVAEAYVRLAQAREYVALLSKAREAVAGHVALAQAYVAQGMLVESELLRAEVELSRLDDLLAQAQGQDKLARANLAFRLGLSQDEDFQLEPLPMPRPPEEELDAYLASARERADLRAAEALLAAARRETEVRRAALYPKAALVARADWVDDRLFGSHGDSTTLMAVVSMNLFAGGSQQAAIKTAQAEAQAAEARVGLFAEAVLLEVRQAYTEAHVAVARVATAQKALRAAAEVQRITAERFRQGVAKMIDVLDAETARREAETRELVARSEAQLALLQLAVKAGRAPELVLP